MEADVITLCMISRRGAECKYGESNDTPWAMARDPFQTARRPGVGEDRDLYRVIFRGVTSRLDRLAKVRFPYDPEAVTAIGTDPMLVAHLASSGRIEFLKGKPNESERFVVHDPSGALLEELLKLRTNRHGVARSWARSAGATGRW